MNNLGKEIKNNDVKMFADKISSSGKVKKYEPNEVNKNAQNDNDGG